MTSEIISFAIGALAGAGGTAFCYHRWPELFGLVVKRAADEVNSAIDKAK